jgi:hypothetical protein
VLLRSISLLLEYSLNGELVPDLGLHAELVVEIASVLELGVDLLDKNLYWKIMILRPILK